MLRLTSGHELLDWRESAWQTSVAVLTLDGSACVRLDKGRLTWALDDVLLTAEPSALDEHMGVG